jgi:hypothetical protein
MEFGYVEVIINLGGAGWHDPWMPENGTIRGFMYKITYQA